MKNMLAILTCLCLTVSADEGGAGLATHSKLVLLDLVDAYDSYLVPKTQFAIEGSNFTGVLSVTGGGLALLPWREAEGAAAKRVFRTVGGGLSVIGSALLVGSYIGGSQKARAEKESPVKEAQEKEKAFLKSEVYQALVKKMGPEKAKEFYQDMKAGVSLHRLVQEYLPREAELGFLTHFRKERVILSKIVPETMMEPRDRREFLDLIASRRAMVRMMMETATPEEGAKLIALLNKDETDLRAMVAKRAKGTVAPTTRQPASPSH